MMEVKLCLPLIMTFVLLISTVIVSVIAQDHTPLPPVHIPEHSMDVFDIENMESLTMRDELEDAPGIQHDFRIEVAAGKSECFYQKLAQNAQLYLSFQVLKGGDTNIEVTITGPGGVIVEHVQWSNNANVQKKVADEGIYRFCLNNEPSLFSSKLVFFYMVTYIEEKWHQHSKKVLEFFEGADGILASLQIVDERVKKVHLDQVNSRMNIVSDWYLIQDNNSYVQMMSAIICVIVVVTSAFQVFFVRRLFGSRNVAPKSKPRA